MKKVSILCLAVCLLLTVVLSGCSTEQQKTPSHPVDTAKDLTELYELGMASFADGEVEAPVLFPETDLSFVNNFYYGIQDVELAQHYFAMAPVTNAPMEIALVEVANKEDVETVKEIFQARIEERSADGAYTEEAAVWKNNARVTSRGNYVFLAVLTDDYEIPEAFILE